MAKKQKIGRNDPCPCGSGKKYKNCCYPNKARAWKTAESHETPEFTVTPKEMPEPVTHHIVSSDGGNTWESKPGLLAVRVGTVDPKDIDENISSMKKSVLSSIEALSLSDAIKRDFI